MMIVQMIHPTTLIGMLTSNERSHQLFKLETKVSLAAVPGVDAQHAMGEHFSADFALGHQPMIVDQRSCAKAPAKDSTPLTFITTFKSYLPCTSCIWALRIP